MGKLTPGAPAHQHKKRKGGTSEDTPETTHHSDLEEEMDENTQRVRHADRREQSVVPDASEAVASKERAV